MKATRKPVERHLSIIEKHGDELFIAITVGKQTNHYCIEPLAGVDFGSGFAFTKDDGTIYNVNVNGNEQHCDCRGANVVKRAGGCKHAGAARKLQELGILPKRVPNKYAVPTIAELAARDRSTSNWTGD